MADAHPDSRIDEYTSLAIIGAFGLVLLGAIGGLAYLIASGAIETDIAITGDITVSGTIPLGMIALGIMGGIGWALYVAFSDIYGTKRVEAATEQVGELTEEE